MVSLYDFYDFSHNCAQFTGHPTAAQNMNNNITLKM